MDNQEIAHHEPVLYANAFRRAILRLLGNQRVNDAVILSCLYEAEKGLAFHPLSEILMMPSGKLTNAAIPSHWLRAGVRRLIASGWVDEAKVKRGYSIYSITTAGRVMIHRLNQMALAFLDEQ